MIEPGIAERLRSFIQHCIPNVESAELLLLFAREPRRARAAEELVERMRPAQVDEATVLRYLARFAECGIVAQEHGGYRLARGASAYRPLFDELARLYNEQPVTLVRMIYAPKDERIRAFAHAFRLKP